MLPLRLVIDMNVLVSAALKPESLQRPALVLAIAKPARLYLSQPVLDEYEDVLSRPELHIRRGLRLRLLQLIRNNGHLVKPSRPLDLCSDPDDSIFLECADKAVPEKPTLQNCTSALKMVTKEFEKEASRYAAMPLRGIYLVERRCPSKGSVRPGELRDMRWQDL